MVGESPRSQVNAHGRLSEVMLFPAVDPTASGVVGDDAQFDSEAEDQ
jgi:hypothetical protein